MDSPEEKHPQIILKEIFGVQNGYDFSIKVVVEGSEQLLAKIFQWVPPRALKSLKLYIKRAIKIDMENHDGGLKSLPHCPYLGG